jgi:hypothetical protein
MEQTKVYSGKNQWNAVFLLNFPAEMRICAKAGPGKCEARKGRALNSKCPTEKE